MKDLLDTAGVRTTAASNQYRERVPSADSKLVRQLKQAGAVIIGKLNLHEFAFGMSGVVSAFGPARNPWNTDSITGGSSSGSGAAVAAGLCVASIGTDTAGSIRCPSALCGIVGHRPSAGVLSAEGMVPLARSFDTAGPMTRTVEDAAILLQALATSPMAISLSESVSQLRVGLPSKGFFSDLQPDVMFCVGEALTVVKKLVSEIRDMELGCLQAPHRIQRRNLRIPRRDVYAHPELYDPHTLARVSACAGISATDYIRAGRELLDVRHAAASVFEQVDLIITPTVPIAAPNWR